MADDGTQTRNRVDDGHGPDEMRGEDPGAEDLTQAHRAHEAYDADRVERRRHAIHNRPRFEGLQVDPEVDFYPEVADREPGDTNIEKWGFDFHPQVSLTAGALLVIFIFYTLLFNEQAEAAFGAALNFGNTTFGWLFILSANVFILACGYFAFSRFGKIRLGGPKAVPEFSNVGWYSMLFSAGVGIGLMFWSVAEPIWHMSSPPPLFDVAPNSVGAASAAMAVTFFHWSIHPWAMFILSAIGLGFFAYNRGLPLTMRSVFYPLLGEKIYGWWGHTIDILTVLGTLTGLATTLGFGVSQAAAGLNFVFGFPNTTGFQVVLIAVITGFATLSVVAGLDGGVKRLAQINMVLAMVFVVLMMVVGPTIFIFRLFNESAGEFLSVVPRLAFWNEALTGTNWQQDWTVFIWGWTISWAPFVGMFIARISKGRSIREIVLGGILMPSAVSIFWISVMGGTAINLQLSGARDIATAVHEDVSTAMFDMFQALPLTQLLSILAIILVVIFFVTSSDSGSLVVDHLTSGGKLDSPVPQRIFWAIMEGTVAAVLLLGGGLAALRSAAISTGVFVAIIMLLMIWSLHRSFNEELDLLEGHYDELDYRSQHAGLIERTRARAKGRKSDQRVPQDVPEDDAPEVAATSEEGGT